MHIQDTLDRITANEERAAGRDVPQQVTYEENEITTKKKERNITPHPPTLSEDVFVNADNTFSIKIGGTIYAYPMGLWKCSHTIAILSVPVHTFL